MSWSAASGREGDHVETVLRALADERRRLIVRYLRTTPDGVASVEELIEFVTSHTSTGDDPESVSTYLVHTGLPILRDAGFIKYDPHNGTVRYTPVPLAEQVLDCIGDWTANVPQS